MASDVLAVATLSKKSMIPADGVQNTFVFHVPDTPPSSGTLDTLRDAIILFYNASHSPHFALSDYMSQSLSIASETNLITWYLLDGHLDGTPHGAPIRQDLWTLGSTDSGSLPDEVAAVITYQRAYGSDVEFGPGVRPRARDRGRLYIGPFGPLALGQDSVTKEPFVAAALGPVLEEAALHLITDSSSMWSQWSRANATTAPVVGGWVDDAFDSQRRRGNKPTARVLW